MDFNVNYVSDSTGDNEPNSKPAWGKSSVEQSDNYKKVLGSLVNDIDIPHATAVCHDKMCSILKQDICAYHYTIIMAMIQACSETIPISKSGCSNVKAVARWNEYIEGYFRTLLFWHSLWIDNGKPRHGIVADLRCKTRIQYYRVCKMVVSVYMTLMALLQQRWGLPLGN